MSSPFIGEIRMFAGNFAPNGWAFCDGSLIPISENEALFALIGTTYGGDGVNTFALPDLRGRIPIHQGTLPGTGTVFTIGQGGGVESVTLTTSQIPAHGHTPQAASGAGAGANAPAGNAWANWTGAQFSTNQPAAAMDPAAVGSAGGSQPHDNMAPFVAFNFILSLFGIFPTQS